MVAENEVLKKLKNISFITHSLVISDLPIFRQNRASLKIKHIPAQKQYLFSGIFGRIPLKDLHQLYHQTRLSLRVLDQQITGDDDLAKDDSGEDIYKQKATLLA